MNNQIKYPFVRELVNRVAPHEVWACASSIKVLDEVAISSTLLVIHPDDAGVVQKALSDVGLTIRHLVVAVEDFDGINLPLQPPCAESRPVPTIEEMSQILAGGILK